MRRPVDPLGYSEDAGIFVYRSDPNSAGIAAHQARALESASTCSIVAITLLTN